MSSSPVSSRNLNQVRLDHNRIMRNVSLGSVLEKLGRGKQWMEMLGPTHPITKEVWRRTVTFNGSWSSEGRAKVFAKYRSRRAKDPFERVIRRKADTRNVVSEPKSLTGLVLPYDGAEKMPRWVISIDPGWRSALTVAAVVREKEQDRYTFRSAELTRAAYTKTARQAAKAMQEIANSSGDRAGLAAGVRMQSILNHARIREDRQHAQILKDLLELLRRPTEGDNPKLGPAPKARDVMIILGGASGKCSAAARALIRRWVIDNPELRVRLADEFMTSKVQVDGEPLGESFFASIINLSLALFHTQSQSLPCSRCRLRHQLRGHLAQRAACHTQW
jgi:hypothetical protein